MSAQQILTLQQRTEERNRQWRQENHVTDWEYDQIERLLCGSTSQELALMIIRLQGRVEILEQLRAGAEARARSAAYAPHAPGPEGGR